MVVKAAVSAHLLLNTRESKWDMTCETKICIGPGLINFATDKTAYLFLGIIASDVYIRDQDEQQVLSCRPSGGQMKIALFSTSFMLLY